MQVIDNEFAYSAQGVNVLYSSTVVTNVEEPVLKWIISILLILLFHKMCVTAKVTSDHNYSLFSFPVKTFQMW